MSAFKVLQPEPVAQTRPDPPVRGESILRRAEEWFLRAQRLTQRVLPEHLDPLAQTGAIANTTMLVAVATGVLLLVWYSPSVYQAHASLEAMRASPLTAQLVRSLHRYSSDACMLFVLVHAAQIILARRITGPRWVAWITGVFSVAVLWLVGWLGYWLVWDERAHLIAVGTSKAFDLLPIFADPMSRSFLVDETVGSMLFFMVFFFHMLIPLAAGVALWLHIARLSRPRFLTKRTMTWWVLGTLVAVSLVFPATSAAPAKMTELPGSITMDWWYLLPLAITDRLSGGALWALTLVGGIVLFTAPKWMARGRARVAVVDESKCNACRLCFEDCPYDAISMVPRTDGRNYPSVAKVDPDKCVGCGICAGSCNPSGIGLPQLPVVDHRRKIEGWVEQALVKGEAAYVAFLCASSAGGRFRIDAATGLCADLPGYRVFAVPCSGWVHPLTVERALKRGASGVLVIGCGHGEVTYREGAKWTGQRFEASREPKLRHDKLEVERVRYVRLDPSRRGHLLEEARRFREGVAPRAAPVRTRAKVAIAGVGVAAVFGVAMALAADAPYSTPARSGPELVVSLKHPGRAVEGCRKVTDEEKASMPVHMRRDEICERTRASVRVRVRVDGEVRHEQAYAPRGLRSDGNSIAVAHVPVTPGEHEVAVEIGDTPGAGEWAYTISQKLRFDGTARRVLVFDKLAGFTWHPAVE